MSWRSTDEWPDDKFVLPPDVIEESLKEAVSPPARPPRGEGRRMRRMGRSAAAVVQVGLLLAMVLVPAGAFASKPQADPTLSGAQTDNGKGKVGDAKGKADANAKPNKGQAGADKAPPKGTDQTTKGNGGSKDKGTKGNANKPDKGSQGQTKKAAPAAETTVAVASGEPTISSDKPDYPPGGKVVLAGTNWQGDEPSGVQVTVNDDAGKSWSYGKIVDVAKDGTITDRFRLPDWFAALYTVTATGLDTGRVATTTFTDASIGTYDQCSNDDGDGFGGDPGDCNWINGNLNANNSTYQEGDATVQRLWLTGFEPGTSHTVTFQYGTTKSATHAYDFLTTWNWSENWISTANRCEDIAGCTTASEDTIDMEGDSHVPDTIETGLGGPTREFVMRGGTLTNASVPALVSGSYGGGDSETAVTVSFTVAASGDMCATKGQNTTCAMAIWFGAHIAKTDDWVPVDTFGGATQIPGSPYHVSLEAIDGASAGQRDNQMQTGAVVNPFNLIIVKNTVGGNDTFDYTVVGAGLNDFSIVTSGATGTHEFLDLAPGTDDRSVTEDPPPPPDGWNFTSLNCSLTVDGGGGTTFIIGGQTVTVTKSGAGDTLTCTYLNKAQGSITIIKDVNPEPDATDFSFTATGPTLANFLLDDDADVTLSNTKVFSNLAAGGNFSITEDGETGYNLSSLVCTGLATGDTGDNTTAGVVTITSLEPGQTVECTYTNEKLPTIIVKKITTGVAGGPFDFTTTGGNGFTTPFTLTTSAPGVPGADSKSFLISAAGIGGDYTVIEGIEPGFVLTDVDCQITTAGVAGTTVGDDLGTRTGTINDLSAGTTVTCTFTNSGALTTRTQGFWATHLSLLSLVWNSAPQTVGGIVTNGMTDAEMTICPAGSPYLVGPLTVAQVEGGFWSSIAKTSTGTNRNAIDKARMRLIQQLLAAILNNQLFGSSPIGVSIDQAKAAYCGNSITAINTAQAAMAAFNESGDSGVFTPGASANPKAAKAIADYIFWDVLP